MKAELENDDGRWVCRLERILWGEEIQMKRLTKSVSGDLRAIMVGFGFVIGVLFPVFTKVVLQLPKDKVLSPIFFTMCIGAGILVGIFNYGIYKIIIVRFLDSMTGKIKSLHDRLSTYHEKKELACSGDECHLSVISADMIGDLAGEFNTLIDSIRAFVEVEFITAGFLEKLKTSVQIDEIGGIVIEAFADYFGGDGGCVLGVERGRFVVIRNWNTLIDMEKIDQDYFFRILTSGDVQVFQDIAEQEIHLNIGIGELQPRHMAFIPLHYQAHQVGVAVLLSRAPFKKDFTALESRNFINQATPFLYNGMLMKRMEILAAIDELTGVLNRRFGMKRLNEEFDRSQRHALPLSIAMIDIDNFKKINDTYGHPAGDFILKTLADLFVRNLRASDFAVRFGGEEFFVAVPGASAVDCFNLMERIRSQAATLKVQYGSYALGFTFSGGISSFPSPKVGDANAMIQMADDALYKAKESGKNRLIIGG